MATTEPASYSPNLPSDPVVRTTEDIHVELTPFPLNPQTYTALVRSPHAGATVLFLGTTRDTFSSLPVASLAYTSYTPLAITTLYSIASTLLQKHNLTKIAIAHRLGDVHIGEESIVIAVSSKHRKAAWEAGEEALEETKAKAEIWKLERFVGGEGVWRANRDGVMGVKVGDGEVGDSVEAKQEST